MKTFFNKAHFAGTNKYFIPFFNLRLSWARIQSLFNNSLHLLQCR